MVDYYIMVKKIRRAYMEDGKVFKVPVESFWEYFESGLMNGWNEDKE